MTSPRVKSPQTLLETHESLAPVEIFPADSRQHFHQFLRLPWSVYRDDPAWIPPLFFERKMHFSTHNPYYQHAEVQTWIARRGNQTLGRISAQIDQLHLQQYGDSTGFFGFIEAENDAEVFAALFNRAENWLRSRGMARVRGPFNFSINEECGLLVEGFDSPPAIMMGHARPYYAQQINAQGYQGIQDLLAYQIATDFTVPVELDRLAARLGKRVKLRPLNWKNFQQDLAIIKDIFEDAWAQNWGFIPFTDEEFTELGKNLKLLVPGEFVRIAEVDGEPAAMMVVFPNLNEAIRDLNGRLLPFGWLKLLWRLKISGIKSGRVPLMGVRQRYQDSRLGAILALMMITALQPEVRKRGMRQAEMSWILESNTGMRKIIESIGGWAYKRYRIYEKTLRQEGSAPW